MPSKEHHPYFAKGHKSEASITADPTADRYWLSETKKAQHDKYLNHDLFSTIAACGTVKHQLRNALNGTPITPQEQKTFYREYIGRCQPEVNMLVYNAFSSIARRSQASSTADILAAIEYPPNASRKVDQLVKEIGANFHEKDIALLEHDIFTAYFATLLSSRNTTYKQVNELALRITRTIYANNPTIKKIIDISIGSSDKLADFITNLPDAERHTEEAYRAYLSLMLRFPIPYTREERDKLREILLRYAREVTFNEDLNARLAHVEQSPLLSTEEVLDWKILPPGSLTDHAREIVESITENTGKLPVIDLRRLTILENIRKWWGEDRAYFARGIPRTGRKIHSDTDQELPDEYLMVILQHFDDDGNLVAEDAVAQSPIAGPHALYIQRQAVNGWDWRELMAYPKHDTLSMGTRKLLHTVPEGEDLVANLTRKTQLLLESSSEDFTKIEFSGIKKDGAPRIRLTRTLLDHIISEPKNDLLE